MPRKITIKDLKNKRDYNAWKIELENHKMADTHAKHDAAVAELARREEMRIVALRDTLWEAAVPFFGVNISPEELKAKFELIMNDNRNAGIVRQLREREEERVRALEAEDMTPPEKPEDENQPLPQDEEGMFRLFQQFLEWLKANNAA